MINLANAALLLPRPSTTGIIIYLQRLRNKALVNLIGQSLYLTKLPVRWREHILENRWQKFQLELSIGALVIKVFGLPGEGGRDRHLSMAVQERILFDIQGIFILYHILNEYWLVSNSLSCVRNHFNKWRLLASNIFRLERKSRFLICGRKLSGRL